MRVTRITVVRFVFGVFVAIAGAAGTRSLTTAVAAQERPLPDFATFSTEVRKHLATDDERQSGFVFQERRTEEKLDSAGRTTQQTVSVFEVYPGLPGEDRYRRLIEKDGKAVSPADLAKHDRERQQEVDEYTRRQANASDRQKDDRHLERERARYRAAIDDLFRIYDIRLVRRETIDGHDTILATLTPNGVKPLTDDGKVMRHFKALAWVSESDFELVRVEMEALDDLSIGWGLLARIHKGTTASYQRRKINDEAWLPSEITWTASARVLLVRSMRLRGSSRFSSYRKFTVDTSTTYNGVGK